MIDRGHDWAKSSKRCSSSTPSATTCPRRPAARTSGTAVAAWRGVLFFFDVFVRRVTVRSDWAKPYAGQVRDKVLRREPAPVASRAHGAAPQPQGGRSPSRSTSGAPPPASSRSRRADRATQRARAKQLAAPAARPQTRTAVANRSRRKPQQEEDYTSRLLKAKKKVWEERNRTRNDESKPNDQTSKRVAIDSGESIHSTFGSFAIELVTHSSRDLLNHVNPHRI